MRAVPLLRAALLASYILLAWISTLGALAILDTVAVGCLGSAILLPSLLRVKRVALAAWGGLIVLLVLAACAGYPRLPGYFTPSLILGAIATVFGSTLAPGATPLVARFVRALDGNEFAAMPKVARYARGVTLGWTALLGGLALTTFVLALGVQPDGALAALGVGAPFTLSPATWSFTVGLGCYGISMLAFAAEFALRRFVLPEAPRHRFSEFARRVAKLWPELRKP